jgi:hypothetical protein
MCGKSVEMLDSNLQMPSQHVLTTATSTAAHVDQQENAQPAKEQHGAGHEQGGQNGFEGWHGNLHSSVMKKSRMYLIFPANSWAIQKLHNVGENGVYQMSVSLVWWAIPQF